MKKTFYTKAAGILAILFSCLMPMAAAQEGGRPHQTAALAEAASQAEGYEYTFPAMATLVSLKAFHTDKAIVQNAFELAEQRVHRLEAILTDYDPQSETRQLGPRAAKGAVVVSDELWQTLLASEAWHKKTQGAFDSSLGSLTRLWRKYRRIQQIPPKDEIASALAVAGWEHVALLLDKQAVRFDCEGLQLDFGAIGKGLIVDEAFKLLVEQGVPQCLVNISGNMRCGAAPPDRAGWRIEISPLEASGKPLRRIEIVQQAIATSGDLWQYVVVDGQRRSHILDPQTGMGVPGPIAATVIASTGLDADAFATAACILNRETSLKIAKELGLEVLVAQGPPDAIVIDSSAGFPSSL